MGVSGAPSTTRKVPNGEQGKSSVGQEEQSPGMSGTQKVSTADDGREGSRNQQGPIASSAKVGGSAEKKGVTGGGNDDEGLRPKLPWKRRRL